MIRIKQVLQNKGYNIWSISPDATVFDALKLLADKGIGALLVMDGENLVGILSERDYARKVILHGRSSMDTPVRDIMTHPVFSIGDDETITGCMQLMTEKRIRHLPVYSGERLVGVVSIGDIVKAVISQQEFTIEQLENYISGK